ncbi:Gamma-D-glutamyl-L-diamino acid endopeptidase 1 [bioreactor metagenome]|uniref:Gamma-D-glutamyl-L-diamino acid endopeptidase 1 n=1 Tax=bioreactor metagenome TaxID=1076179 RepID=A0A645F3M0_9ZZZZ
MKLRHATAYHTQGEVIYWQFEKKAPKTSRPIANILSTVSGYGAQDNADGIAAFGGFKDWVIDKIGIPAFTIEAGIGKNPLPLSQFDSIYQKNLEILLLLSLI